MENKKISFGFLKTKKAEKPVVEEKKDFIECVEEKYIKVVGGETVKDETPLVIPMKPNTLITAERLKEIAETVEKGLEEVNIVKNEVQTDLEVKPSDNETLDQMAVRELLQGAKTEVKVDRQDMTVPVPAKTVIDGEKESTLEDYESVPIQDFGMAMLRGMGWTPNKEQSKYKQPDLRPKGLGLGADKVVKENQKKKATDVKGEELAIVKNSFVKITTGKYLGCYGKVVSLDEDNGRVMVDIAVKKETVSLSEFMMQPVTKSEFDKESKVINTDAYVEYKRLESQKSSKNRDSPNKTGHEPSSSQHKSSDSERNQERKEYSRREDSSNGRHKDKLRTGSSDDEGKIQRHKKDKKKHKHRSSSISSGDEKKKKDKSRRRHSTTSDDSETYSSRRRSPEEKKRDIDKKRKGKKKKRDRDRSPNYKKHRK